MTSEIVQQFGGSAQKWAVIVRAVNTKAAATYLGVSTSSLEKYRVFGGGPKYCKIGNRVVYRPEDLDEWLRENLRRSTSEERPMRVSRPDA